MYVARSYHYSAPKRPPSQDRNNEKDKLRRPPARQRPPLLALPKREAPHTTGQPTTSTTATPPTHTVSEPAVVPSKPVVIPTRTASGNPTQTVRARGANGGRGARVPDEDHSGRGLRPAVAALLAVTSIPPPNKHNPARYRTAASSLPRRVSIDQLVQSWREEEDSRASSCANSVLELLLEQPDDEGGDDISVSEGDEEKGGFLTSRSVSSESIPSTPGLDADVDERSLYSWSSPHTPTASMNRSSGSTKAKEKTKVVASPSRENCILDHPLLVIPENSTEFTDDFIPLPKQTRVPKTRSSFKSNLTASFQALKSAARSFSNFTAPSVPPDDLLARSFLSPLYVSEMRPKPSQGVPTPELRRYLNPTAQRPPSPTELSMQLQEAVIHAHLNGPNVLDYDKEGSPMIQMQTYSRNSRPSNRSGPSRKKRGADPNTEAGRALLAATDPAIRQREPRENSDFLRVIVLEMNMRREGKLDVKAQGRARLWLPPRKARADDDVVIAGRIPVRWIGVCVDEDD